MKNNIVFHRRSPMKRILSILLLLSMLLGITPAFASAQVPFLGEWKSYGTMYGNESEITLCLMLGQVPPLTTSRVDQKDRETSMVFFGNGTMYFAENGAALSYATWTWEPDLQRITVTRMQKGSEDVQPEYFFYEPGFLTSQTTIPNGNDPSVIISVFYQPEALSVRASEYAHTGWELLNVVENHERTTAFDSAVDYCFSLHEDGTASILANYLPRKGTWQAVDYTLVITDDRGNRLTLEPQLNNTLYGTYNLASGKVYQWEFGSIDAFDFTARPASLSAIRGTWEMIGLYQPAMGGDVKLPVTRDQLTFGYRLELSGSTFAMHFDGSTSSSTTKGTFRVVSGPILDAKEHTGTIVIFTYEDGSEKPFWLHPDGSLRGLNPGNMELVFEKTK